MPGDPPTLPRLTGVRSVYPAITQAARIATEGSDVPGVDVNAANEKQLTAGQAPNFEPGAEEQLRTGLRPARLAFTTSCAEVPECGDVRFARVGNSPRRRVSP
jgi:UDPglucose 6-dehydrogenase